MEISSVNFFVRIPLLVGSAVAQYEIETMNNNIGVNYLDETRVVKANQQWTLLVPGNIAILEILKQVFETNNRLLDVLVITSQWTPSVLKFIHM